MTGSTPRSRRHRLAAAAGVVALLVLGSGCSTDIRGRPVGGDPQETSTTGDTGTATGAGATGDVVDTAAQAWELAGLTPPEGAETVSALARPTEGDLPSYLVVLTTTPERARQLCEQLGGRLPVGSLGLSDIELTGWALESEPPGDVGVCQASKPGDYDVQRDVLLAEADGAATVWLSTYRLPR
jgi:hypothetical protein